MLDIRLIRERTDFVKAELDKVGFEAAGIDAVLAADARRRALIQEVETLRAKRSEVSRTIGKQDPGGARSSWWPTCAPSVTASAPSSRSWRRQRPSSNASCSRCPTSRIRASRSAPTTAPTRCCAPKGTPRQFGFTPRPHWELGPDLGHHRLRARREDLRLTLLRAQGRRRAPAARADRLDARPAHAAARLHRDLSALPGEEGMRLRRRPAAEVRRQHLPRRRGRPVDDRHRRDPGHQPAPRRDPRGQRPAPARTSPTPRASGARRCPPAATCAASSAGISSTRSRCTRSSRRANPTPRSSRSSVTPKPSRAVSASRTA